MAYTSNLAGTSRTDYTELVNCLAIKHRKKEALRCLMAAGFDAASALRAGLENENADVRVGCCESASPSGEGTKINDIIARSVSDGNSRGPALAYAF